MDENKTHNVVVTDIQMPFMSMVVFMVKWVIAAIPAMLILTVLATLITAFSTTFMQYASAPSIQKTPSQNHSTVN